MKRLDVETSETWRVKWSEVKWSKALWVNVYIITDLYLSSLYVDYCIGCCLTVICFMSVALRCAPVTCFVFYYLFYVCLVLLYVLLSILCVLCFCILYTHVYSCSFSICIPVCWPLPSGGNTTAVNKYIISYIYIYTDIQPNTFIIPFDKTIRCNHSLP